MIPTENSPRRAEAFFSVLTRRPWLAVFAGFAVTAACAAGLPRLVKDTSVEAFIPQDHPSIKVRERAQELFGLRDPIAIAVMADSPGGIYRPEALEALRALHLEIENLDNVRRDRVMSLASESSIGSDDEAIYIEPYLPEGSISQSDADRLREAVSNMPPHLGTLVANDGSGALILAELRDESLANRTYQAIRALGERARESGLEVHVAGQAAIGGYLSRFIDEDARRLQPVAVLIIVVVVFLAFLRLRAVPGPLLVVVGAAIGTIGLMAWIGDRYYAITSALPVVIIAIAVADAIHILTRFYELREQRPESTTRDLVVGTMADMWKPVTLTTLTTMAGFTGIALASIMPPIGLFGWYAALGVLLAWFYSLYALPNLMILLKLGRSPVFARWHATGGDAIARALTRVSLASARHPVAALSAVALLGAVAALGASQLRIDRLLVANFSADEPIRIADGVLNASFAGSSLLDVLVAADEPEGLIDADRMDRIARLQDFIESQPNVGKTVAITDYVALLHRAFEGRGGDVGSQRRLPEDADAVAQYLLVYESSGDPTELEEEIDADYRHALVRAYLTSSLSSEERPIVEAVERYIDEQFNAPGLSAELSGRVNVDYHWMQRLATSHFESLAISMLLILGAAVLLFRSVLAGVVAVAPVSFAILCLYGVMGASGVYLEPSTSMFAAISLGLGVDYAIHLIARIKRVGEDGIRTVEEAVLAGFPAANRACFFNALALAGGFSVLLLSELATLQRFGALIAVATISGFVGALIIVPAVFALRSRRTQAGVVARAARAIPVALPLLLPALHADPVGATDGQRPLDARDVAERVAARPVGDSAVRELEMVLTDRRGRTRQRAAMVYRRTEESVRKTRFTFTAPKSIRETTFLSHDHLDPAEPDNRWLYLPAAGRARRIPPSDRGDYFLGTDFTYEDIDSQFKFDLDDYAFGLAAAAERTPEGSLRIVGTPVSPEVRDELGYGGFSALVDTTTWLPMEVEFLDVDGRLLKTMRVLELTEVEGIWEPQAIAIENHQTGHRTEFRYTRIELNVQVADELLTPTALHR